MNEIIQNEDFFTPESLLSFAVACGAVYAVTLSIQSAFKIKNPLKLALFTSLILSTIIMLQLYKLTWTTLYLAPLNGFLMYASILGAVQSLHREKKSNDASGKTKSPPVRRKYYKASEKNGDKKEVSTEKFDIFTKWY